MSRLNSSAANFASSGASRELPVQEDVLLPYMSVTPFPLAFERYLEACIYRRNKITRPTLDVGCGDGLFGSIVFKERLETGIDPNSGELERAKAMNSYDELIECFGNSIPKPDESYNTIISNSVVEHIPDLRPVLLEIHRLLKPNGRLYLTVPSEFFDQYTVGTSVLRFIGLTSLADRFRRGFNKFWRHYHYYSLEGWQQLLTECGFTVVDAHMYGTRKSCLLNDFLAPFSFFSFVTKKLFNRWTLLPTLWNFLLYPLAPVARRFLAGADRCEKGGLVFLALTKELNQTEPSVVS